MLYFLVGQSNTGKDTILNELLKSDLNIERFVYCTTRPMRDGEENGKEYWFKSDKEYQEDLEAGKILESRAYPRTEGVAYYYTLKDIDLSKDYIAVGSVWQCQKYLEEWGSFVKPIRIFVDDYIRLKRGIEREHNNKEDYKEVCRRYLDEFEEYSEENLNSINFGLTVVNNSLDLCCSSISDYIQS